MSEYVGSYVTDDASGEGWRLMLGDSCERLSEIETESVDLSVSRRPLPAFTLTRPLRGT